MFKILGSLANSQLGRIFHHKTALISVIFFETIIQKHY